MNIEEKITAWLQELEDKSVFLVAIDWKPTGKKLHVMMDGDNGITVEQCRKATKLISLKLDEEDFGSEAYTLEVSSPGADKPLLLPRQYPKHIGRELDVKLKAQTQLEGRLKAVTDTHITLQLKDKKKRYTDQSPTTEVAFDDIQQATVIISFK